MDPDPAMHRAAAALVTRGHQIFAAHDAEEGLRVATKNSVDVVVLSPELPQLDLAAFIRHLRMTPETALVPIIFLAAKSAVESSLQGFALGSDDFLPKPVDVRELELRIAVAKKIRERAETTLRPRLTETSDFSSATLLTVFRGSLDQISLPSLLSLIDMERKTGALVIVLEPSKEKLRIFFNQGRVVRASYDKKDRPRNAELIYDLLGKPMGRFEFRNVDVDAKDEIQTPIARLLLEGARLIDESRRG
jgi:CheY-like chemotaxis protein